jgi:thiamine-monophosphate kinase
MRLNHLEEKRLVEAIRREFGQPRPGLALGIGDDAAVITLRGKKLVITKDLLLEDVHFSKRYHLPRLLGRKSLNVNLSDLAAMGAWPLFALLGLGLPPRTETGWIVEFFAGFKAVAKEFGVGLIGGDVTRSSKITISVTLLGEGKNIIKRSSAKPGHLLFVSGTLGEAREGLLLVKKKHRLGQNRYIDRMLRAFLDPVAQVELGRELARLKVASAMIDISDGLSVDLVHLGEESGCGAEIHMDKLPVSSELRALQRKAYDFALNGGEDYQLLFSVAPEKVEILSRLKKKHAITLIGKVLQPKGIYVIDRRGRRQKLVPQAWQHFT